MRAILFAAVLVCAAGCCSTNREAIDSLNQNWRLLEPATRRGIDTDPDLSEESKVIRRRNVEEFGVLLEEVRSAAR